LSFFSGTVAPPPLAGGHRAGLLKAIKEEEFWEGERREKGDRVN